MDFKCCLTPNTFNICNRCCNCLASIVVSLQETVQPWALAASHVDLLEPGNGGMTKVVVVFSNSGFLDFSFSFLISRNIRPWCDQQAEERVGLRTRMTSGPSSPGALGRALQ